MRVIVRHLDDGTVAESWPCRSIEEAERTKAAREGEYSRMAPKYQNVRVEIDHAEEAQAETAGQDSGAGQG